VTEGWRDSPKINVFAVLGADKMQGLSLSVDNPWQVGVLGKTPSYLKENQMLFFNMTELHRISTQR
jgi:hypothetical protein